MIMLDERTLQSNLMSFDQSRLSFLFVFARRSLALLLFLSPPWISSQIRKPFVRASPLSVFAISRKSLSRSWTSVPQRDVSVPSPDCRRDLDSRKGTN